MTIKNKTYLRLNINIFFEQSFFLDEEEVRDTEERLIDTLMDY